MLAVSERGVDERVVGIGLQPAVLVDDAQFDALAQRIAGVVEVAAALLTCEIDGQNVVRVLRAEQAGGPSSFWSLPNDARLPRRPSSKVCETTCLSGGSAVRKLSIKHGNCRIGAG